MIGPLLLVYNYYLNQTDYDPHKARAMFSGSNAAFLSILALLTFVGAGIPYSPQFLLQQPEQTWLADYVSSYFVTDLFLGHLDRNLHLVTGYIHHSVYVGLVLFLQHNHQSNLIFLCLPFEIPTLILDIHKLYPAYNYKPAFAVTFMAFRLITNAYMISTVVPLGQTYSTIASAMLVTHIAWFIEWNLKIAAHHRGNEE
jgi:hypothetical protein